jgi:DNA helicase HerA-like ATPase
MDELARIRLLMGTTGSGKTYKMRELLNEERRVFLFDTMADPKFEDYGILCDEVADGVALASKTPNFRVRFQFSDLERFDFVCRLLVKKPHGYEAFTNVCLAVDELALFTNPHWMPPGLNDLTRLGRHTGAKLLATTQRPPDINIFIRSQCKENYLFQMHEKADLDTFRNRLPEPERLVRLKIGEYMLWNPTALENKESLTET